MTAGSGILHLPWPAEFNALAYALSGTGTVGLENRPIDAGQLAVFGNGNALTLTVLSVSTSSFSGTPDR